MPKLSVIGRGLADLLTSPAFYGNLQTTAGEVAIAIVIGSAAGLLVGLVLGVRRFLGRAFEPYLYYLGPTPKIIFFPIMIMWFGTGPGSKIALGAVSCFPVALAYWPAPDRCRVDPGGAASALLPCRWRQDLPPRHARASVGRFRLGSAWP